MRSNVIHSRWPHKFLPSKSAKPLKKCTFNSAKTHKTSLKSISKGSIQIQTSLNTGLTIRRFRTGALSGLKGKSR